MEFKVYMADVSPIEDVSLFDSACRDLPPWCSERLCNFERAADRRLFVGSRLLLRQACRDAGLPDFPQVQTERKKPFFPDYPEFQFNLSHSGTMALCAVADVPVGCDIEALSPAHLRIAGRVMAPSELTNYTDAENEAVRIDWFYRLWTLKESYVKLTGEGIAVDFRSLTVETEPALRLKGHESVSLFELPCPDCYRASCCIFGKSIAPALCEIDITSLI